MSKAHIMIPLFILFLFIVGSYKLAETNFSQSISDQNVQVQLLGVNDLHGQLDKDQTLLGAKVGGAEYLSAYLKKYKGLNENTLLVHAGDMIGGSPPLSSHFQDEPTIELLNLLKFDIGTPGNHELDEGVKEMQRLIDGGFHEKTGDFPGSTTSYISSNIINKKTNTPLLPPYVIKQINGIKIGFIGVLTTETNQFVLPEQRKEIEINDEVSAVNQSVQLLKEKGVKSIVVLAHVPVESNEEGTNPQGDLAEMASKMDDEIDVIFGAHNHRYANTIVDGKLIVQSYSYGKAFSQVLLSIDPTTKDVVQKDANIIVTSQDLIEPDKETLVLLQKYREKIEGNSNTIVGVIPEGFSRKKNANGESPLAKVIAESSKNTMDTEIAFVHHGGIRASIKKGYISKEDLYTVLPFDHTLKKLTMTGEQIKLVLEQQWTEDKENILQAVGVTYQWDSDAPVGSRILEVIDREGNVLETKKEYEVTVSNYLASGGDGFTAFKEGRLVESGPRVVTALMDYIQREYSY
ncbi:bifunctional metallophosphatase/5'-nucleotidase [Robertmurraya korlensis]|uniref:bifunctional metallophosphatase/5'-nucleotidase n=1 Tax=Robertmurraya korlensis TaxID=519977 RepID=UPI000825E7C0|nr:5'-nucleotidase C-terminal domain-containing protein [Robertmurraya korlensis]